jgi:hypothetical protein
MAGGRREIPRSLRSTSRSSGRIAVKVHAHDRVEVLRWILGFFMCATWIYLLVVLLGNITWSNDLSGWGRAAWLVCLIVLPLIGAIAYVVARRARIAERQQALAVTSRRIPAVDVARLAELHDRGLLTDEEYVRQRMRALS